MSSSTVVEMGLCFYSNMNTEFPKSRTDHKANIAHYRLSQSGAEQLELSKDIT